MSKVAGFIIGAVLVAAGIITGNPLLIIQGATMIVTQAVALLTAPKAPARQASEMTVQLGEQPRSGLFGECFTAGSLVDAFDFGGKYGTDWEVLIIRLADHKCEGLTGFYVNDVYVAYTGNGNYEQFEGQTKEHLHLFFRADTSSEALASEVTDEWPGWTAGDTGQSGCDVAVLYRADLPTSKNPIFPGGRPRFGFVVKGKLCYDPRLDDTVGGSGDHRWDDPDTWEWSENAAICRYNWVRGIYANDQVDDPTQLLIGRGLSAAEAPPAHVFAAANLCDEEADDGVRYRVAGPVYANQSYLEVEEMFAAATGGSVVTHEGSVELEPGAAKSVVATFTDDDLLAGSKVSWNGAVLSESDGGWINTVVANYVEPAQQWNDHDAPVVRDTADILADGGPRESTLTLRLVKWVGQAQRVAEISRRLGRLWGRGQVTLGPRFCEVEEGDWVQWQSNRRFGGATRTFRVEAYSIDEKWHNTLTLREIAADVFGDGVAFDPDYSVVTLNPPPPAIGAPDGGHWALAAVTLTSAGVVVPALEITGAAGDDESAEAILVEYWKSDGVINPVTDPDDPPWATAGTYPIATTKVDVTGIEGGAAYYAAVTYVVSGALGDRLVLGPVTAADVDVSGAVQPQIDDAIAAAITGLSWKTAVRARTTAALAANTYANGSSGVGATLTGNSNGALAAQDGVTLTTNQRLLVANEATGSRNGIYKVTQVGDGSHPYILTRVTDADEAGELVNATVYVSEGTANADTQWTCTTNAPITVGTTSLAFGQMGAGGGVTTTGSPATGNLAKFTDAASITNGDLSGDATTSGSLAVTIANDAVSNAKLANMAASTIKARKTGSTGDPEDCTLSEVLDFIGSAAQGDVLYRGASGWARLGAGTSGFVLTSNGAAANPSWQGVGAVGSAPLYAILHQVAGHEISATTWTKRVIDTEILDEIGITITSGVMSLPAGTYEVIAWGQLIRSNEGRHRLRDTTNSVTLGWSMAGWGGNATGTGVGASFPVPLVAKFTLAGTTNIEFQTFILLATSSFNETGVTYTGGSETYTAGVSILQIKKLY